MRPPQVQRQRQCRVLQRHDTQPVVRRFQLGQLCRQASLLGGRRLRSLPGDMSDQRDCRRALPRRALALVPGLPRRWSGGREPGGRERRSRSVRVGAGSGAARCSCCGSHLARLAAVGRSLAFCDCRSGASVQKRRRSRQRSNRRNRRVCVATAACVFRWTSALQMTPTRRGGR